MTPAPIVAAPRAATPTTAPTGRGPTGTVRPLFKLWLLSAVTLGLYGLYALYQSYEEMHRYNPVVGDSGAGLLIAFFAGPVNLFYMPSQIAVLHTADGERPPVSVLTGFWLYLPLIGWFVWWVKVYSSLNRFWTARGAR